MSFMSRQWQRILPEDADRLTGDMGIKSVFRSFIQFNMELTTITVTGRVKGPFLPTEVPYVPGVSGYRIARTNRLWSCLLWDA